MLFKQLLGSKESVLTEQLPAADQDKWPKPPTSYHGVDIHKLIRCPLGIDAMCPITSAVFFKKKDDYKREFCLRAYQ